MINRHPQLYFVDALTVGSKYITSDIHLYVTNHTTTSLTTRSPPLDNIRVMVIVWRLRGNIIRTALCWIVRLWVCHIGTLTLCVEVVA